MIVMLLIFSGICIVSFAVIRSDYPHYNFWDLAGAMVAPILAGLFFSFIASAIGGAVNRGGTNQLVEQVPLESLERTTGVYGSFALGCGTVDGGPAFCYYVKTAENTYVMRWAGAKESRIIEDGNQFMLQTKSNTEWSWWTWERKSVAPEIHHEFHIPKGSIKPMFKP